MADQESPRSGCPAGRVLARVSYSTGRGHPGSKHGTAFGGTRGRTHLPQYVYRYMAGRIKIDEFVTAVLPLEQIKDAFDLMHRGEAIRTVIRY